MTPHSVDLNGGPSIVRCHPCNRNFVSSAALRQHAKSAKHAPAAAAQPKQKSVAVGASAVAAPAAIPKAVQNAIRCQPCKRDFCTRAALHQHTSSKHASETSPVQNRIAAGDGLIGPSAAAAAHLPSSQPAALLRPPRFNSAPRRTLAAPIVAAIPRDAAAPAARGSAAAAAAAPSVGPKGGVSVFRCQACHKNFPTRVELAQHHTTKSHKSNAKRAQKELAAQQQLDSEMPALVARGAADDTAPGVLDAESDTCHQCLGASPGFRCSVCDDEFALYCSPACQRKDWRWHARDCTSQAHSENSEDERQAEAREIYEGWHGADMGNTGYSGGD